MAPTLPYSGRTATHHHPTYGNVRVIYTQHGGSRIDDGHRHWTVPTDSLARIAPAI